MEESVQRPQLEEQRRLVVGGLERLRKLRPADRRALLPYAKDILWGPVDYPEIAATLGLAENELRMVLNAILWSVTPDSSRVVPAEQMGIDPELLAVSADLKSDATFDVRETTELVALSNRGVASIRSADVAIDVRLEVEDETVKRTVPIAILRIDTDGSESLVVQLNRVELRLLSAQLNRAMQELTVAEKWTQEP